MEKVAFDLGHLDSCPLLALVLTSNPLHYSLNLMSVHP